MFTLDFLAGVTVTQLLKPTTCATAQTSAAFDTNDYEGKILIVINSTKGTDDNEVLTPTIVVDEATGGSYATTFATLETVLGGATAGAADKVIAYAMDANATKQFLKVVLTPAGTTPAFVAGITVIGKKRQGA